MGEAVESESVATLDAIVLSAVSSKASDIHLEPKRDQTNVRLRIDGELVEHGSVPSDLGAEIISRIKVLANMDIAERRVPQDGQLTIITERGLVHLRASSFPTNRGEKVVLRVLSGHSVIAFDHLGLDEPVQRIVRNVIDTMQGFFVTSGPTGSGKTSTLYSLLSLVDTQRSNVITLEDPIEIEVPAITQGQTNVKTGFTFAAGLRAILRQDPDVIMVGEIRDAETAAIALQASLTGHLVFSTLHTSDAVETAVRLVDLGVEPWIVANSVTAIVAQRLVRRVCQRCRVLEELDRDVTDHSGVVLARGTLLAQAVGCTACHGTGYRGRIGIFEAIAVDDEFRELIKAKASPRDYRSLLQRRNVPNLRRAGLNKVRESITTIEEVVRVTA